jgi:phosphate starvation-inducible PhoH-like protein
MKKTIPIDNSGIAKEIFGVQDQNIQIIEDKFHIDITLTSDGILVEGNQSGVKKAIAILEKIIQLSSEGLTLSKAEIKALINSEPQQIKKKNTQEKNNLRIKVASQKKCIFPKAEGQRKYTQAISEYDITFAVGPAGTGKTYLAMAMAVHYLIEKKVRRIILTRPAIEAGESLGFLPGTMSEKLTPYLRPLYDALYDMMEADIIEDHLESGTIEIAPLAYMRGRTLNDAFIILDEAQNCTLEQLKMFLTRPGFNSKTVISGDITQTDLPGGEPNGLIETLKILKPLKGIKIIELGNEDVVRHPLIQKIIEAYEFFYKNKKV